MNAEEETRRIIETKRVIDKLASLARNESFSEQGRLEAIASLEHYVPTIHAVEALNALIDHSEQQFIVMAAIKALGHRM